MYEVIELLGRGTCFCLALATLGLSIMMSIVPSDYGNHEAVEGEGMLPPLFTFIFVAISLILNTEEIISRMPCYRIHFRRLHPAFVLAVDIIASLGLLLSAYVVMFPAMFQFPLVRELIWVSTALAAMHVFVSGFAGVDCNMRRRALIEQNQQAIIQRGRERALRLNRHDVYV
ncbi:unnamed protein product [Diplocarpon coronariae]|uniref:Uncharacterized protein n=1 Tax=Diplocarpon coronariae TaxID=2795749 RepID=A0A218Z3R0_9HELO|nr:hypothetical protein JHW43_005452 [Diplocarpon mali]OWP02699.1 hypothetical protein B2J93_116 [Marssonina coronariae]